ncbi:MAG TPA: hypothetical protein VII90_03015 [Anaerolineales bacterium]
MTHSAFSQCLSGKLRLEEHILTATPGLDSLIFDPVGTIQEVVLTRNVDEGVMGFPRTAIAKTLVTSIKITGYTLRWITQPVLP